MRRWWEEEGENITADFYFLSSLGKGEYDCADYPLLVSPEYIVLVVCVPLTPRKWCPCEEVSQKPPDSWHFVSETPGAFRY